MKIVAPAPIGAFERPLEISLVEGEIVLLSEGHAGFSMTPAAAQETRRRLDQILSTVPGLTGR